MFGIKKKDKELNTLKKWLNAMPKAEYDIVSSNITHLARSTNILNTNSEAVQNVIDYIEISTQEELHDAGFAKGFIETKNISALIDSLFEIKKFSSASFALGDPKKAFKLTSSKGQDIFSEGKVFIEMVKTPDEREFIAVSNIQDKEDEKLKTFFISPKDNAIHKVNYATGTFMNTPIEMEAADMVSSLFDDKNSFSYLAPNENPECLEVLEKLVGEEMFKKVASNTTRSKN